MGDPVGWCIQILSLPQVQEWLSKQVNKLVIRHLPLYAARVAELVKDVEKLKKSRIDLQHKVDEEEDRRRRGIPPEVKKWIEQVDEIIFECEQFNGDKSHELAMFHDGYLPKLGIRYHLSKKSYDLIRKVNGLLLQKEEHKVISFWLGPPSIAAFLTNIGYESFSSRDATVKKINAALKNPSIRVIGVYGLSGVGKTTLVKEIAKEALQPSEAKMFEVVIMANVTKNPDIRKMQGQIADMLGMALDEESDIARADRIRNRLKNEKKSTLIILDDLWAKVDFNMLGIPFENHNIVQEGKLDSNKLRVPFENDNIAKEKKFNLKDRKKSIKEGKSHGEHSLTITEIHHRTSNGREISETPSHYIGCKVLLISESIQILSSQMEGKEDHIFCVDVLEKKEAEAFFKKMAADDSGNSGVDKLATQIADKCHKLPMSIVTTAKALKGQSRSVWEDVLRKLEWQKSVGVSNSSTKLSYDLLEDEEIKFTFLLCARMVHDALIADLVKYCIGLGFLQGIYTVRQARDRVYALVEKLKDSGLLSDSYSNDRFTMQNIIRSAALSIASKENDVFTMTKRKIDEWPDKLERYTAISLHHCDIVVAFPGRINWPRLRFFHVHHNGHHLSIPENFFKGMKELKVLILTGICLSPLPSSIKCLTKLRMLCLEHCELDENLSIIGELKSLRILSFSGSDIKKLSVKLNQLTNLQIFDISNCSKLEEIAPNVISSLSSLEELYMRDSLIQTKQGLRTILSELRRLKQLTTLDIQIPNTDDLTTRVLNNLFLDKLYSYKIVIGDLNADLEMHLKMPEKHETSRFLAIQSQDNFNIHSQMGIKMLFERVETLLLEDLKGAKDVFYCLNLKGFPCLKHLLIVSNSNIQSLINPKNSRHPEKAFPKLESLYLYDLKNMKELCSCELSKPSFDKLKVIKINLCGQLKHVFSVSVVKLLTVLQTIEVFECNSLREVVCHADKVPKRNSLRDVVQSNVDEVSECNSSREVGLSNVDKVPKRNSLRDVVQSNVDEVSECNSSREVGLSNVDKVERLDFPELRSLTLQSLSDFDGFYPISPEERERRTLFNDKVVVSKLERLELSSIRINEIWSGKLFEQGSHFQKLTHLDVNGCSNLKYLVSFSMAYNLVNLQSLFVSDCPKMKCIFSKWEGSHPNKKARIFQNLKNIKMSNMKSLKSLVTIEGDFGLLSYSFSKLDTLIIEECHKLSNVFPSFMVGKFQSLCKLRVTNCRSMIAIFDLNDEKRVVNLTNLQDVHVEALPKLEHVWKLKKDQKETLKLDKLQKIWVHECDILENIFPVAVAKCLNDLECLIVSDCIELREIIAKREATNTGTTNPNLPFGKLKTVKFLKLPKLASFCPWPGELCNFPVLNDLSINHCDKLEPFNKGKIVLFPEMVTNKLESMQIESWHAKSSNSYMGERNHRMDNLEELCLSRLMDIDILYSFLHHNPNLESLSLNNCFFDSIVPLESCTEIANLGVVPKLKSLKLIDMPNLENLEFKPNIILQRIDLMILKNCPCLVTIVPSSVSLMHLTNLEVVNCNGLESLMLPSTAESLGQLSTMKVINCESLKEIVRNEEENADNVDIVFEQLKTLELVSLKNLNSFCCSKSCVFEFPSLEKLVVSACYKMKIFSKEVSRTPILQKIYTTHEKEEKRSCWEGSLNATIQKMFREKKFFEGVEEMSFSEHLELQKAWQDGVGMQNCWFYSLKTLKLEHCEIQPCAIPSNILPYLKSLKELEVRGCKKVKVIFGMNDTEFVGTTSQLKKLTLEGLSELTRVWEKNGQGNFSFQNLEVVFVSNCENLQSLFPVGLAKNLKKLDKLVVEDCDGLVEIVGKEEDIATDTAAAGVTKVFLFTRLSLLSLCNLPQLTHFYPGSFILECPTLNDLFVLNCLELKLFENAQPEDEGSSTTSINRQSLFPDVNAISNIETLSLDWKHFSVLRSRVGQLKENLEYLNGISVLSDGDENEKSILPVEILEKAPNLQRIGIGLCDGQELFRAENPKIDQKGMLGHLKRLTLFYVSGLESIGSNDSLWLKTICEKLKQLNVAHCPDLTTLTHSTSTATFSCLKILYVSGCDKLEYLFTSSTAKTLMHLEEITIKECESIKKIVQEEQEETSSEGITFKWLHNMELNTLSNLECFYSGNDTLHFPSLVQVHLRECPEMKFFSQGPIEAKSFRGIQASSDPNDDLVFYDDFNLSVKSVFLQQKFDGRIRSFSSHPELQEAWQCESGLQNNWFSGVKRMKLVNCDVQPYAIPSHILPYLSSLKELEVQNCDNVKVIFDTKDTEIVRRGSFKLQKLTLKRLPKLTHVLENNRHGILSFQNLQHVSVDGCDDLQSLFPAALPKNLKKLEILQVKHCDGLLQIVEKVEDAAADITEKFVFPRLTLLELSGLPQLTCFYPETFILECPALKKLSVFECDKLEVFNSNGEGSSSTSINKQPLFFDLKVIPNLEESTLDWKTPLRSRQFREDLKYFHKINLSFQIQDEICLIQDANVGEHRMPGPLKILNLKLADNLQFIVSEDTPWLNSICEKLHKLKVSGCDRLTTLIHPPSGIFLSYLKKLIIRSCDKLEYLFTSSAAKKLMHLEMISAEYCHSIKEIVAREQQNETTTEGIKFEQLCYIKLYSLPSLECFYSGNDTLELPSLKQMIIRSCPKMEIFSQGSILANSFKGIQDTDNSNDDLVFHNDMNYSVKRVFLQQGFLQAMDIDCLSDDHPELQEARYGRVGLQNKWLCDLVTLKLDKCILPYAIPSSIFPYLKNLKELEVRNSNKVKVIFDMKDTDPMETAVKLEKLHLEGLSKLTYVWEKNSQGVVMFQNLQHVIVKSCDNLETLFPVALAKNLKKLKELKIESCDKLLDIVEKEEDAAVNVTENFAFPCLEILDLNDLPQFTYFYPQTFTLECTALNKLKVLGCPKLELFQSAHPEGEGEGSGTSITRQPHISYLKVISNVEELSLDWKHISALSLRLRSGQFTEGLKYLNDISLYFDADENEEPFLPTEVLQKAPNLKELRIGCCNSLNIILAQNLEIGEDGMLGLLRGFTLDRVSKLQSINSVDSSWLNAICEKLHKLNVFSCPDLTTLIQSTSAVSFSCLREMCITRCPELQYLFTSSTAKMLMNIEAITVEECESMKKIVAIDDETTSEGIRFEQLRNIYLISLSSLECFYSGDDILQLSSLIQVKILQCPKMEIFSQGLIHAAESFRGIQSSSNTNDQLVFHEDLNTSVKNIFLQQDPLVVRDSPLLKEIWLRSETVPDWGFHNLNSMVVESCEFLSNAILPSHLLPLLRNLKKLQVKKCNSVKSIFGHSRMGSQGSQSLPFLEELHVKDCEELVQIVAKEEDAAEEANQGLIIFSSLTSLKLSNLPNLRSIYSGMCMLEWPVLKELEVSQCQMLNFFTTEFQNSPDSHLQGQDSFPIEQQAIVSLKKVTPHLEKLSLGKKEAMMIEQGKLCVDLPVLNFLGLPDFHDNSDEFPFAFYSNATFTSCFKQLVVSDSDFKEIFPSQTFNIGYAKIFSQLKQLHIVNLFQLQSIGLEYSWMHPFLQNLEALHVRCCDCLTNLTPSTVSFSNLTQLSVDNCHGLKYLFTSSTAKTLRVLESMKVSNCHSIEAIVAKMAYEDEDEGEGEGEGEDEVEVEGEVEGEGEGEGEEDEDKGEGDENENEDKIIFGKLQGLTLDSLPKLKSFYSGSSTLNFPSLEEVSLTGCNNMQVFSYGDVVVPEDLEITIDAVSCEGDINSSIKQNIAMKRQPEKSLSGERSLLVSTHGSLDSSNNAKME